MCRWLLQFNKEHLLSRLTGKIQDILENWMGEDDAGRRTAQKVAEEIDHQMQEYLQSLPRKTAAIVKGQQEYERRVA